MCGQLQKLNPSHTFPALLKDVLIILSKSVDVGLVKHCYESVCMQSSVFKTQHAVTKGESTGRECVGYV